MLNNNEEAYFLKILNLVKALEKEKTVEDKSTANSLMDSIRFSIQFKM